MFTLVALNSNCAFNLWWTTFFLVVFLTLPSPSCLSQTAVWILAAFGLFLCPADLAQNDLRLFASLEPLTLPVTAVFNLEPGFALRYAATPFFVMPAPLFVGRKLPDFTEVLIPNSFFS